MRLLYLQVQGYTNCYSGNLWDSSLCPDPDTCTNNCAIDGIDNNDWSSTYGVSTSGNQVELLGPENLMG